MILFVLISVFFVSSCKDKKRRGEIEKIVSEWIGIEILFPEKIRCQIFATSGVRRNLKF